MTTSSGRPAPRGKRPGGGGGKPSGGKPAGGKPGGGKPAGGKPAAQGGRGGSGYPRGGRPQQGGAPAKKAQPVKKKPPLAPVQHTDAHIDVHDPDGVRLQKLLAAAGVGSRRTCEDLIATGRVEVDGQVVTELGVRIDPLTQSVHVDGERVVLDESRVYLAFNKPLGVVTTMDDEMGRPSIQDYVGRRKERLFHVGRLDADTEGLLILTNDGDLAHRLQHPQYHVEKTYVALVPGPIPRDLGRRLREGVVLDDGPVKADSFRMLDSAPGKALVEVVIHEGRKHIVRRMLAEVGHPVLELVRVKVGPVMLGDLMPGKMRPLTKSEIAGLYGAAGM